MLAGLDHPIIACSDPAAAAAELERVLGLHASGGGRHDAHGTYNRLVWLGDSYLELMGVFDTQLAHSSWWGRHVQALLADADAAYAGVALATDDVAADVDRLRRQGSPISDPIPGQRVRPDGDIVRWRIARLPEPDPEMGLVFLIEHDHNGAEWRPADRDARSSEAHPLGSPARLERLSFPVADASAASMRLLRELGLQFRPSLAGGGARDATVGRQTLRLARHAERPEIVLRGGTETVRATLLGCRWLIEPATPGSAAR